MGAKPLMFRYLYIRKLSWKFLFFLKKLFNLFFTAFLPSPYEGFQPGYSSCHGEFFQGKIQ